MFIKLLVYFYRMIQLPINCILMRLRTHFMFEVQINYMWSQKKFKMNKILRVTTFILYVVPNFSKIVYTIMCFNPFDLVNNDTQNKIWKCAKLLYM